MYIFNYINKNLLEQALVIYKTYIKTHNTLGKIGDYCDVKSGFAFKSNWWVDSGIPVIKIGTIEQDNLNISNFSYVNDDKLHYANDFVVVGGDVVIAMTGATIGKYCIIPKTSKILLVNQRVGKFNLGKEPINKLPFLYCTLKQPEVIYELANRGQGSAQPNMSPNDIMSINCIIPSDQTISVFNNDTKGLFQKYINNQYENFLLSLTRNQLLPKLMSGEIDVSKIDI